MSGLMKSPWIIHYDASSCNGCDIEVLACLTPLYDVERFGILNTGNPKHADIFVVTGSVNEQNRQVIKNIYDQMPKPNVVIGVGICACSGGVFKECYNVAGGVGQVIPGWDEGVQLMTKGEKGVLYIPYYMGYGERQAGDKIVPFSSSNVPMRNRLADFTIPS